MDPLAGLLAAVAAHPLEDTPRLVLADCYADRGEYLHEQQCRLGPPPVGLVKFGDGNGYGHGNGDGYGHGYGYCDGNGDGNGYGDGYGHGYGYCDGNGDGNGYGYGDGYGHGHGDGYGDGYGNGYGDGNGDGNGGIRPLWSVTMPEVGRNQLIVLPHGWVVCGFVAEQTGPYLFRVENTHVICRTGGVPWDELADGKGRQGATFRKWGTVTIGPQFVMSREWNGKLPTAK